MNYWIPPEGMNKVSLCQSRRRDSLHALRRLPGHVDAPHGAELGVGDVQVAVQTAALTPLGDDGKVGLGHVAHEEQDVDVTGLPVSPREEEEEEERTLVIKVSVGLGWILPTDACRWTILTGTSLLCAQYN